MSNILVTGSRNGLGAQIVESLRMAGHNVAGFDIEHGDDVRNAYKEDIMNAIADLPSADGSLEGVPRLDVLINNAGVNGIDFLEDITDELWDRVMGVNAKGIMKMSQACLPLLKESKGTIVNVISNAAWTPMTSSACYNASKGAALTLTKQMARELTKRHGITVFGVSPNKLKGTKMSEQIDAEVVRTRGWTPEEAQRYQLAGLLSGEETDPKQIAELLAFLLQDKAHHSYLTGCNLQLGL